MDRFQPPLFASLPSVEFFVVLGSADKPLASAFAAKEVIHRHFKARQQSRANLLALAPAHRKLLLPALEEEHFHRFRFRIDDPVLSNPVLLVKIALLDPVAVSAPE